MPEFHGAGVDAGRLAASETRMSSATVIHEDTIEDPPAARKGAVRPVSGMTVSYTHLTLPTTPYV